MLAQIKALPKGDMKTTLLDSFLKTMAKSCKSPEVPAIQARKPNFVDASFERNTKSFIRHNRN